MCAQRLQFDLFVFFNIFCLLFIDQILFLGREKCAGWFAGDKEREEGMKQSWRTKCARINLNRFVGWQKRRREIIIIKQDQGYKIKTNAAHRVTNELINNNHQFIWKKEREMQREKDRVSLTGKKSKAYFNFVIFLSFLLFFVASWRFERPCCGGGQTYKRETIGGTVQHDRVWSERSPNIFSSSCDFCR